MKSKETEGKRKQIKRMERRNLKRYKERRRQ